MNIRIRYAQEKSGQRMHIVPVLSGDDNVSHVALCGKRVSHWRMTCNVPLANCCKNCMRVERQTGASRLLDIVRAYWNGGA